ncbi:MAG: LacI family DNA-binding transcriptional regulator [Pseudomonadota bacterium]
MTKQSLPTLDDVAALAGVSTATVSRTLNFPEKVREGTRIQVTKAVRELGYSPHFGARYLASNRTNTVGAVIPTMENSIFAYALQTVQEALADNGITLLVATSQYNHAQEEEQIRTLISRGVDGMVLIGQKRSESVYSALRMRELPYVLMWLHRQGSPHASVGFDNFRAAQAVAARVLKLGHRRICMIAGHTQGNDRAAERVAGVRAELVAAGLPLEPPFYTETDYNFEDSAQAARKVLALEPRPTALICGNDVIAVGVVQAARQMSLRLPDELSIVGFDDIDLAQVMDPPLTTVRVPHRRMGAETAKMLLQLIRGEAGPRSVEFEAPVVERASLGPAPTVARE